MASLLPAAGRCALRASGTTPRGAIAPDSDANAQLAPLPFKEASFKRRGALASRATATATMVSSRTSRSALARSGSFLVQPVNPRRRLKEARVGSGRGVRVRARSPSVETTLAPAAQQEPQIKLESLEPYFYYMGRKGGVTAYGIEFKEFLRQGQEQQQEQEQDRSEVGAASADLEGLGLSGMLPEGKLVKGVGVYAAQDIDATAGPKIIMEIPLPLMVTVSRDHPWMFYPNIVPLGHPIFDVIESTDPEGDWDLRLACLILLALDPASSRRRQVEQQVSQEHFGLQQDAHFLTEYCDFMPPLDDCPALLLASEEDLGELQDEALMCSILGQQERARVFWEHHWGEEADPPSSLARLAPSERQFRWAVAQAQYRGLLRHAPMGTVEQDVHMLIPYADMMNHSFSANCSLFWRKIDRVMEVRVTQGVYVQAGEELTLNYAKDGATNRQLMEKLGFSMLKNPWEHISFSGEHKLHRDSFFSAFDIVGYGDKYGYSDPVDETDVDPYQDETVIAAARCLPTWAEGALPCLPSEEIRGAKGLQGECLAILQSFDTDVEEDMELLRAESSQRPSTWTLAVKYRIDRKMFLLAVIDALEMYMERLIA